MGVMPLPPPNSSSVAVLSFSTKRPAGGIIPGAAFLQRVMEPVGALAAGDALHRDLGQAVGLGRARQRIAAVEGAVGVTHLEGQELAGAIAVLVGKVGGDFEDEGSRIWRSWMILAMRSLL